tara:strand:+ start:28 stop:354 length:327 start_codon:yes stop_codon:yes gene_type:complete
MAKMTATRRNRTKKSKTRINLATSTTRGQSPYNVATRVVWEEYTANDYKPIPVAKLQEAFESTIGLTFPPRTDMDKVLGKLEGWGVIQWGEVEGLEGMYVIPSLKKRT